MPLTRPPNPERRDTAGEPIEPPLLTARPGDTAAALHHRIRESRAPVGDTNCVVEEGGQLIGLLSPGAQRAAADDARADALARRVRPRVLPDTDREQMVSLALQHRLAGTARESGRAARALEEPPLRRARHRLPWLVVALPGACWPRSSSRVSRARWRRCRRLPSSCPGSCIWPPPSGWPRRCQHARGHPRPHADLGAGARGRGPAYGSGPLATIVQDMLTLLIRFGGVTAIPV